MKLGKFPLPNARLVFLVIGLVLLALSAVAIHDALSACATGCVRAKYGLHCRAAAPARYAITLALTMLAGAAAALGGLGALYAGCTRR